MNIKGLLLIGISFMMLSGRPAVQANDILNQNRLILNVEDFGAVGDGITDDGPALRKLFEHASALGSPATIMFRKDASYYLGKEEHAIGSMFLNRAQFDLIYHLEGIVLVFGRLARQEMAEVGLNPVRGARVGRGTLELIPKHGFGRKRLPARGFRYGAP